jgi:hypothetical protein
MPARRARQAGAGMVRTAPARSVVSRTRTTVAAWPTSTQLFVPPLLRDDLRHAPTSTQVLAPPLL